MRCVRAVAGMLALGSALALALPGAASALQHDAPVVVGPRVAGVPIEFVLFGLTLAGVALFHRRTLQVALAGLAAIAL